MHALQPLHSDLSVEKLEFPIYFEKKEEREMGIMPIGTLPKL